MIPELVYYLAAAIFPALLVWFRAEAKAARNDVRIGELERRVDAIDDKYDKIIESIDELRLAVERLATIEEFRKNNPHAS